MVQPILEQSPPDPFFTLSPDMLCVVGGDGRFERVNPRWTEVLGYPERELLAHRVTELVHPSDREATSFAQPSFESRVSCRDGSLRWLSWSVAAVPSEGVYYCVVHDVTERKATERRLAMQLAITRLLGASSTVEGAARALLPAIAEAEGWQVAALWRPDPASGELRCEEFWRSPSKRVTEFERITRRTWFPRGEGIPGRVWTTVEPVWIADLLQDTRFHRAFWAQREGLRSACAFPVTSGAEVLAVIELFGAGTRAPDPRFDELLAAIGAQIGEFIKRKNTEEALKTAQERLRSVVAHAPIVLFAVDREGRFTFGEGRGLEALGVSPHMFAGRTVFEIYRDVPQILEQVRRALRGEAFVESGDLPGRDLSYETRYTPIFDANGQVVEAIGVAIDITDRRKAEAALRRSEARLVEADRLASLGTLAAGVAHEINNPLSYVLLNLDAAIRDLAAQLAPDEGEARVPLGEIAEQLREARAGLDRVRHIVQDLKAFSRVDAERRGPVDVRAVLDQTIEIAANEIRHRARLVRDYDEVPPVLANTSRLGQVFLNLLVNAAQALCEGDAAQHEIRVTTGTSAQGRAVITIADTGAGIPPEVLGKIFDPFFTTKPAGVGTGLGLSICHGIVTSLGGEITAESRLGEGTTFRVTLPPATIEITEQLPSSRSIPPPPITRSAEGEREPRGRVLIVDDERALANALARSLEPEFEVAVATSGREAIARLAADDGFDVILCDLNMPLVTGMDVHHELQRIQPALAERMIFMTGGTFTERARDFLAEIDAPTLDKPFDLGRLRALLRARITPP